MSYSLMTWMPLIALVIAAVLFGPRLYQMLTGGGAERKRLLEEGLPARATVQQVGMGSGVVSIGAHRYLQLRMQLQVEPPGRDAYSVWASESVSELHIPQVQPGVVLETRVDPANPNAIAVVGVEGGIRLGTAAGVSGVEKTRLLIGLVGLGIGLFYALKVAIGF